MVKHLVLLRFESSVSAETIDAIYTALAGLKDKIAGLVDFSGGPYDSPEGLQRGFTHGFVMTFDTPEARDAYLPHPEHERVKEMIFPNLDGGSDGVIAFDYVA